MFFFALASSETTESPPEVDTGIIIPLGETHSEQVIYFRDCFSRSFSVTSSNMSNLMRRFPYCPYTCPLKYHADDIRWSLLSLEMRVALSLVTSSVILTPLVAVLISDLFRIMVVLASMVLFLIRIGLGPSFPPGILCTATTSYGSMAMLTLFDRVSFIKSKQFSPLFSVIP